MSAPQSCQFSAGNITSNDPQRQTAEPREFEVTKPITYTWRPTTGQTEGFPESFQLQMEVLTDAAGERSFVPVEPLPSFLLKASVGGLALLTKRYQLGKEMRFSYHVMRLLFQWSTLFRSYLSRSFAHRSDLYVGLGNNAKHLLPANVGAHSSAQAASWTPNNLLEQGKRNCQKRPATEEDRIRVGLFVAAQQLPLDPTKLSAAEASSIIQMALFDFCPSDKLTPQKEELLEVRLLEMLGKHNNLDTGRFRRWFLEDLDNIVHAISTRKKGGELTREEVQTGLLDLAFRSYRYLGDCVAEQMRAFAAALPKPLSTTEQARFAGLYGPKPYWGGLPFVLLHDRFFFLQEAARAHWETPNDPQKAGVILRLLEWYGEMARQRREADRENKRRRGTKTFSMSDNDVPSASRRASLCGAEDWFVALFHNEGKTCNCEDASSWIVRYDETQTGDCVTIGYDCERCDDWKELVVQRSELEAVARVGGGKTESGAPS